MKHLMDILFVRFVLIVSTYIVACRVSLVLSCFVVYSTRRFVVCLSMCHFVLVCF